jgi:anti-sigma regulatory factor (Ser/Thr protein kinase)
MLDALVADLAPDTLGDLRIVVSELVSNAVKYGPGNPVHVELDVSAPDSVRGEIVDHGNPRPLRASTSARALTAATACASSTPSPQHGASATGPPTCGSNSAADPRATLRGPRWA